MARVYDDNGRATDDHGVWQLSDDGATELLVEPSQLFNAWKAEQAAAAEAAIAAEQAEPDPVAALESIADALAPLTSSSTSAVVRSILLNVRAAIDQALGS